MRTSSWVCVLAVIVLAATPRPGEACSPPPCFPAHVAPAGGTVPGGVVHLGFKPGVYYMTPFPWEGFDLALEDEEGAPVAFEHLDAIEGDRWHLVRATLEPGKTWTLRWTEPCDDWDASGPGTPKASTFQTGPALALPTVAGTVAAEPPFEGDITVLTMRGSCVIGIRAAQAWLDVRVPADVVPFLGTMRFRTRVDGETWQEGDLGRVSADASGRLSIPGPPGEAFSKERRPDLVYAGCVASGSDDSGLAVGTHAVVVEAQLPPGDWLALAPAVDVTLECAPLPPEDLPDAAEDVPGDPGSPPDAAAEAGPTDVATDTGALPDPATSADATPGEDPGPSSGAGCAAGAGCGPVPLLLSCIVLVLARAARRRAPC
jgi:hypothetical protein